MSNNNQWRVRRPRQGEAAGIEIYAGAKYVCQMSRHPGEQDMAEANARRIVACVNACDGIKTIDLEAMSGTGILSKANHNADVVMKQRDSLLAALEEMVAMMDSGDEHGAGSAWHQETQAAIAAAKCSYTQAAYECGGCGNEHPLGTGQCPETGYPESTEVAAAKGGCGMIRVLLCGHNNSTIFTNCCEVAICDDQAFCPACKQEVYPGELATNHERRVSRWSMAYAPYRNKAKAGAK